MAYYSRQWIVTGLASLVLAHAGASLAIEPKLSKANQSHLFTVIAAETASPSVVSLSPAASSASTVPPWQWWLVVALIPVGTAGGVFYGLRRSQGRSVRKTQSQASQEQLGHSVAQQLEGEDAPVIPVAEQGDLDSTAAFDRAEEVIQPDSNTNLAVVTSSLVKQQPEAESLSVTERLPRVDIIEVLINDLHNSDPGKRRKAIWELGQHGDSRAVQPLVDLIVDSDSNQRSLVLAAISEIGVRTLKPMNRALLLSVQDDSPEVRKNAVRDVTRIFELVTQISQLLQYATSDADAEVRETAEWALTQLNRIRLP
ncbi:MAG: hypothetical protein Kow00121_41490 [Elainellaceae cyanobacterium]